MKKKLDNETSKSVNWSLRIKNFVEIYNKTEKKLTKIPYSLFFCVFKMSQCGNRILLIEVKLSKNQKEIIKKKRDFFLNSFSVDQVDVFSELL